MRRRPLVLALVCAALLGVAPAAAVAADPPLETHVGVVIELPANHGLRAHLEVSSEEAKLELTRHGHQVVYEVEKGVETSESGLRVEFGQLGLIEATFTPTRTLATNEPPDDCVGQPRVRREGIFAGTIEFHGERGFVQIDTTRVKGKMNVTPEWKCRRRGGPPIRRRESPPPAAARRAELEIGPAVLSAVDRRGCRCGFVALATRDEDGRGPTLFYGVLVENREGMKISRLTLAYGHPGSFVFDVAGGTATVRPPAPFTGHATFKRRPHAPDLWRSTLRVPLLGAAPLVLRGPRYRAMLTDKFFDE